MMRISGVGLGGVEMRIEIVTCRYRRIYIRKDSESNLRYLYTSASTLSKEREPREKSGGCGSEMWRRQSGEVKVEVVRPKFPRRACSMHMWLVWRLGTRSRSSSTDFKCSLILSDAILGAIDPNTTIPSEFSRNVISLSNN